MKKMVCIVMIFNAGISCAMDEKIAKKREEFFNDAQEVVLKEYISADNVFCAGWLARYPDFTFPCAALFLTMQEYGLLPEPCACQHHLKSSKLPKMSEKKQKIHIHKFFDESESSSSSLDNSENKEEIKSGFIFSGSDVQTEKPKEFKVRWEKLKSKKSALS